MKLNCGLSMCDPDAEWFRSIQRQISLESPGPESVVVYESDHFSGDVFKRSVLSWSRDTSVPSPPKVTRFVYASGKKISPVLGFGTSLTDSAVLQLEKLNQAQKDALYEFHFGLCKQTMMRVPIGSCDFSVRQYSCLKKPRSLELLAQDAERSRTWVEQHGFETPAEDLLREKYLMEIVQRQAPISVSVLLAPWTSPPWAKDSKSFVGGKLLPECSRLWAQCLVKYTRRYQELGFAVKALSLQNEPRKLPYLLAQNWETMFFSPEELGRFTTVVAQELRAQNCSVPLLVGDDQKALLPKFVLPSLAAAQQEQCPVWAVGVHSYQWPGAEIKRGMSADQFSQVPIVVTEFCTGFSLPLSYPRGRDSGTRHAAQYMQELINSLRNGEITGFVDWNLLLDERGGPNPYKNEVDSLSWVDDAKRLRISYMAWMFAHIAAFSGTHVCESEAAVEGMLSGLRRGLGGCLGGSQVPLVISFCDSWRLYVTVFNNSWYGTQDYCLVVRGRHLFDTLGYRCAKTYVIKK